MLRTKLRHYWSIIIKHKPVAIGVSISLLLGLIIIGLLWSNGQWSAYNKKSDDYFNSAKTNIDNLLVKPAKGNASTSDKLKKLAGLQSDLSVSIKTYCEVSPLIKWQDIIGQNSDNIKACNNKKLHLSQFLAKLSEITVFIDNEQNLSVIISDANQLTLKNTQSDSWHLSEGIWRDAATKAAKLADNGQFKAVRDTAGVKLSGIAQAWKSLSAANDAKNRQGFTQAQSDQTKAYTALGEISNSVKTASDKLVSELTASYSNTF